MNSEELRIVRRLARAGADVAVSWLASIADKYIHGGEKDGREDGVDSGPGNGPGI